MSNRQFVIVVIITFIVIVIWMVADIWHTKPSVEVNPKMATLLTPIDPTFDQKIISQIKEVTPIGDLEVNFTAPLVPGQSSTPSAQPLNTPLPLAIPAAIVATLSAIPGETQ